MTPEEFNGISIQNREAKMPIRKNFYVLFDNGEVRMHYDKRHPKALVTHWKPLPEDEQTISPIHSKT